MKKENSFFVIASLADKVQIADKFAGEVKFVGSPAGFIAS